MLAKLQQVFLGEAVKYKVLPLDDRRQELFNPKTRRPAGPDVRTQEPDVV